MSNRTTHMSPCWFPYLFRARLSRPFIPVPCKSTTNTNASVLAGSRHTAYTLHNFEFGIWQQIGWDIKYINTDDDIAERYIIIIYCCSQFAHNTRKNEKANTSRTHQHRRMNFTQVFASKSLESLQSSSSIEHSTGWMLRRRRRQLRPCEWNRMFLFTFFHLFLSYNPYRFVLVPRARFPT